MAAAVEEVLRYESPAQGLFRTVVRDIEIDGVTIPEGSKVMLHFGSANRDPQVFSDPGKFSPDRDDVRHHVAFGKGAHFCIGAPLARAELKHSFRGLLDRLPNLRRVGSGRRDTIFFARGWSSLPLAWDIDS
jgi:cytochrome P450